MTTDPTEAASREMIETGHSHADLWEILNHPRCAVCDSALGPTEALAGALVHADDEHEDHAPQLPPTWTTEQLTEAFEVTDFLAPFVFATRKSDGKRVSLEYTSRPRVYFNVQEV